jgi:hypothetical protein
VESVEATIQELQTLLVMIDKQMDAVIDAAMDMEISPFAMRDNTGRWVMSDLLSAKAQSLSSLIYLSGGY